MPRKVFEAFTRLDASDVNAYLVNKPITNAIINGAFDIWQRGTSGDGKQSSMEHQQLEAGSVATPFKRNANSLLRVSLLLVKLCSNQPVTLNADRTAQSTVLAATSCFWIDYNQSLHNRRQFYWISRI
jgi:hypothetical protein